jgi:prolactin regulatory element-binding protein
LKAHDFPPTTLKFNPTGTLLVSGSADNTVRIVSVVEHAAGRLSKCLLLVADSVNIKSCKAWKFIVIVLLAILVAVLALFAKHYIGAGGFKW